MDHLARCSADMPETQAAAFIGVNSLGRRTICLGRVLDSGLSVEKCRKAGNGAQCGHPRAILELMGAVEAQSLFKEGRPGDRLALQPASKSKHAFLRGRRVRVAVEKTRTISATTGSRFRMIPEVVADLPGPLEPRARRGFL